MWEFEFKKALKSMITTLPFIVFRLIIYLGIAIVYTIAIGAGVGVGYAIASIGNQAASGGAWGGIIGFALVSGVLYWAREYILYLVKAGHIAVLVEYLDGKELPDGRGQIDYAQAIVKERFKETSILFGVDQLIKGIIKAINSLLFSIANFLPIPGLENLVGVAQKIINLSLTYTDEIILAYNIKKKSENPWESTKTALILYAQNYKVMLKNSLFLLLFMYGCTLVIFIIFLLPAGALLALFPGSAGGWSFFVALIFAWSVKAALLEPLAVTAMMQVYFKTIEGQEPKAEWDEKLTAASAKFKELKQQALNYRPPVSTSSAN